MPESIDPTSDRPVYRQIADQLRQAIREGRYGEGDALPSETALAETLRRDADDCPPSDGRAQG